MGTSFVGINYHCLAEYLVSRYDVDNPCTLARFRQFRTVLEEQVEQMIASDPFDVMMDEELVLILIEGFTQGSIASIAISEAPAIVVHGKYGAVPLPFVMIKLEDSVNGQNCPS